MSKVALSCANVAGPPNKH